LIVFGKASNSLSTHVNERCPFEEIRHRRVAALPDEARPLHPEAGQLFPLLFSHLHPMDYIKVTVAAVTIPAAWLLFKKLRRSDIADIRGPDTSWSFLLGTTKSRSWTLSRRSHLPVGHLKLLWQSERGTIEEMFWDNYGSVVRIKAPFTVRQERMSQFPPSLLVFTGFRRTDFGLRTLQRCTTSTKPQVTSTGSLRAFWRWKRSSLTRGC
jgi:hypothetical protein